MIKRTILFATTLLFTTPTLYASNAGEVVYEAHCKACHMLKIDKAKMMTLSMQERMAIKQKMMKTMKAPPMSKVSAKLKHDFNNDKAKIVAFIQDYIVNPDAKKSHCMPMALKRFGTMPPIGKGMKKEDIHTIAQWVYENFSETWDETKMGTACHVKDTNQSNMKCGGGKCGSGMMQKTPKQTPQKTGGMKCGAGKCGG